MLTNEQRREIEELVASGQKIVAIKRFREITGVGLQEALHAVEQLGGAARTSSSSRPETAAGPEPGALRQAEAAALGALRDGNVVEAIKRYRLYTKLGLKDSKDAVSALSLVHRSNGRIDARFARTLIEFVAAGRKQDAITQLVASKGYEESEAREVVASLGSLALGGLSVGAGCARLILALLLMLAGLAAAAYFLSR